MPLATFTLTSADVKAFLVLSDKEKQRNAFSDISAPRGTLKNHQRLYCIDYLLPQRD